MTPDVKQFIDRHLPPEVRELHRDLEATQIDRRSIHRQQSNREADELIKSIWERHNFASSSAHDAQHTEDTDDAPLDPEVREVLIQDFLDDELSPLDRRCMEEALKREGVFEEIPASVRAAVAIPEGDFLALEGHPLREPLSDSLVGALQTARLTRGVFSPDEEEAVNHIRQRAVLLPDELKRDFAEELIGRSVWIPTIPAHYTDSTTTDRIELMVECTVEEIVPINKISLMAAGLIPSRTSDRFELREVDLSPLLETLVLKREDGTIVEPSRVSPVAITWSGFTPKEVVTFAARDGK